MKQIAFFGSIGVGKTTAGTVISEKYSNVQFLQEDLAENPFLPSFYRDMKTWGFHSSIAMLTLMSSYYQKIDESKDIIILDNGVEELIAYTHLECDLGILSEDDYFVYKRLYDNLVKLLPKVDLYVYFVCDEDEALKRIKQRARDFEINLDLGFLSKLNEKYREFVATLPSDKVLILDTTNGYSIDKLVVEVEEKIQCKFIKK